MTDRELLELAAKAAGLCVSFDLSGAAYDGDPWRGPRWNPLTDDGDALRLAVKLGITLHAFPDHHHGAQAVAVSPAHREAREHAENHGDDICAATRRAVVRAAAEIGRAM